MAAPPRIRTPAACAPSSAAAPAEQQALRHMAIFCGSFTRVGSAEVAGASLPRLASLINKSLVRRVSDEPGLAARYELPEPLRQFAHEQLVESGDLERVGAAHARFYLDMLAGQAEALRGAGQQEALESLSLDVDQLRAAPGRASIPGGLTAREAEVLHLVAQGLTDAQVAERLVLSPCIVSMHLTSIYGKLGVGSRSAATRFAIEHGL